MRKGGRELAHNSRAERFRAAMFSRMIIPDGRGRPHLRMRRFALTGVGRAETIPLRTGKRVADLLVV